MGNAASHVQHLFYSAANSPRIFNTGMVVPRRMVQSQRPGQSGNRYPTTVINQSEWAEVSVDCAFDKADLVLLLASLFSYKRETNGDFNFRALAGANPTGYSLPKQWDKLQSYNWRGATSGPSYEAEDPILQSLEMNFNRRDESMFTAAFAAKQYKKITQPSSAPTPAAVDTQVVRNSDIRIGLSAGRLSEFAYPTSILSSRWSYTDLVELVFGANQSDRGWSDFVEAQIQPTLMVRFMANADYLTYANVDADTFVQLSDAGSTFEWTHRARFVDVPRGPGAQGNLQEVEIAFLPYARVDNRALADTSFSFTAATDSGNIGFGTANGGFGTPPTTLTSGFKPDALTELYADSGHVIHLGDSSDDWPVDWEPESIAIGNGTAIPLTYAPASNEWVTEAQGSAPLANGARTATIAWKWTPATYMSGFVKGTGVPALS